MSADLIKHPQPRVASSKVNEEPKWLHDNAVSATCQQMRDYGPAQSWFAATMNTNYRGLGAWPVGAIISTGMLWWLTSPALLIVHGEQSGERRLTRRRAPSLYPPTTDPHPIVTQPWMSPTTHTQHLTYFPPGNFTHKRLACEIHNDIYSAKINPLLAESRTGHASSRKAIVFMK